MGKAANQRPSGQTWHSGIGKMRNIGMFQFFAVFSNLRIQIPFVSSPGHQKYQQLLSTSTKPPRENLTMKPFTNYLNLQGFKTFFPLRCQPSKNKTFGLCSQSFPTAPVEVIMRPKPAMDPDVRPCNHQKFASFQPQRFPMIPRDRTIL